MSSRVCCEAEIKGSANWAIELLPAFIPCRGTGLAFFRVLCIVTVDGLCSSAVLLCPGTVQVAWEYRTSRTLRFVAGRPLRCFPPLCRLCGAWVYFFSFGNSRLSWICSVFCGRASLLKNSPMTLKWTIYFLLRLIQCSHLPPLLCFFTPVFPELQAFLEYISCNELCGHQKFSLKLYGINIC